MWRQARSVAAGFVLVAGLSGCPVTDDYFLDPPSEAAGGTDTSNAGSSAVTSGGSDDASGSTDQGGGAGADRMPMPMGGSAMVGPGGGMPGAAGCTPATERCNGHDDNCNDVVDEQACNDKANGTTGCAGFVIPSRPNHGYMLCTTTPKSYEEAKQACEQQSMRLAWLESEAENTAVGTKVASLTKDEVLFGADDIKVEGTWVWEGDGGFQFWKGEQDGSPVDGAFNKWAAGTPNDDNGGEDCAVLNATTRFWGDRSCNVKYAYLCEELEP